MKSEQRKEQELADQTVEQLESANGDRIDFDEVATHELGQRLRDLPDDDDGAETDHDLRAQLLAQFDNGEQVALPDSNAAVSSSKSSRFWVIAASLLVLGLLAGMLLPTTTTFDQTAARQNSDVAWDKEIASVKRSTPGKDDRSFVTSPRVAVPQQGQRIEFGIVADENEKLPSAFYMNDDVQRGPETFTFDGETATERCSDKVLDDLLDGQKQRLGFSAGGRGKLRGHDLLSDMDLARAPSTPSPLRSAAKSSDQQILQAREDLAYTKDLLIKANNKVVELDPTMRLDGTRRQGDGRSESDEFVSLLRDVRNRFENRYIAQQNRLKELLSQSSAPVLVRGTTIHHVKLTELGQKIENATAEAANAYSDRERIVAALKKDDVAVKELLWTLTNESKIVNLRDDITADSTRQQINSRLQELEIARIEMTERYGLAHPRLKAIDHKIADLEASLKSLDENEPLPEKKETDPKEALESYVETLNERIEKSQVVIRNSMKEYAVHEAEAIKIARNEQRIAEMGLSNAEQYEPIVENPFVAAIGGEAISTFSIDVDTASYANMRRFVSSGQLPPPNAVRLEELINYFSYDYAQPKGDDPFSMDLELASCPWNEGHQLLRVGLQGKDVHVAERPDTNVVFLIDVSGSMQNQNKLPLLKRGFQMMVDQLGEDDRVSIVTYAGNAGVALNPTSGDQKQVIKDAIEKLTPGGSTHGSAGIELAYQLAQQNFIHKGSNKVILATDGDLNVGVTNDDQLVSLIKGKAAEGVFLTVLGFGTGNLKDGKLEKLADNGNGVYSYIDSLREAHKVLVEQLSGALLTIAKDVKIQIEFNPAEVKSYRLLGYENRALETKDFDDDRKDAGEIGAGHSVTAIYEIIPAKLAKARPSAAPVGMKYQNAEIAEVPSTPAGRPANLSKAAKSGELATVAVRYKLPDAQTSRRLDFTIANEEKSFSAASDDFRFASSVAGFGMLLRGSEFSGDASLAAIEKMAANAVGDDSSGYRAEFIDLVRKAASIRDRR